MIRAGKIDCGMIGLAPEAQPSRSSAHAEATYVKWHDPQKVDDESVIDLSRRCLDLRVLNLGHCVLLTDTSVASLATHCHNLSQLSLSRCTKLSRDGIHALARQSFMLGQLDISGCHGVSEEAFEELIIRSPSL